MPEALEIARQERGHGQIEAANMLRSTDPRDQAEVDGWFKTAAGREQVRMSPNKPSMKQPDWESSGYSRKSAENKFESQYQEKEQKGQAAINEFDSERETQKQDTRDRADIVGDTVTHKIKQAESDIKQKEPQIKNDIQKIGQKGKERSEKGAAHAAIKHGWKTIIGDDKK